MFVHAFPNMHHWAVGESIEVTLPRKGLRLDPRVNWPNSCKFDCSYHEDGIHVTLTLTRTDRSGPDPSIFQFVLFAMRVYDPEIEPLPNFNSTIYTYLGKKGEQAPADTTMAIIDPSVKVIKEYAFSSCSRMERCIIHNEVETIECGAFNNCSSLHALFLPPGLRSIGAEAFAGCKNIRILPIPTQIDIRKIGQSIIVACREFFRISQMQPYKYINVSRGQPHYLLMNNFQVNQAIIDFHRNLSPLQQVCLDTNVSAQSIHQCILTHGPQAAYNTNYDGMTPLHILVLNPHATTGSILTCFHANMSAGLEKYDWYDDGSLVGGKTPLDCLMEYDLDSYIAVVTALCNHKDAMIGRGEITREKRRLKE